MLARGEHGGLGVFFSFLLPTLSALVMSLVMLQGQVFSKANAYVGILGNALMLVYIVLVTFAPSIKELGAPDTIINISKKGSSWKRTILLPYPMAAS